jgi:hypothetical protein
MLTTDKYVNKQNMRIWGSKNPNVVLEKAAHPAYVSFWMQYLLEESKESRQFF